MRPPPGGLEAREVQPMHDDGNSDAPRSSSESGTPSARQPIAERTVLSRDNAAVEVVQLRLTQSTRNGLMTGQRKLDNVK